MRGESGTVRGGPPAAGCGRLESRWSRGPTRSGRDDALVLADDPIFPEWIQVVGEAGYGEGTLELVTNTDPDAVVMDLVMPRLGGLGATERLASSGGLPGCWC